MFLRFEFLVRGRFPVGLCSHAWLVWLQFRLVRSFQSLSIVSVLLCRSFMRFRYGISVLPVQVFRITGWHLVVSLLSFASTPIGGYRVFCPILAQAIRRSWLTRLLQKVLTLFAGHACCFCGTTFLFFLGRPLPAYVVVTAMSPVLDPNPFMAT
ncbi:hypothetical protein R1flu_016971 [Riccia fluitans]|uniref:Uncharacterized protein n=1 Tax=Riccia fluitans TaxID=41844 RepID=A0ABD1YNF9_9MARC